MLQKELSEKDTRRYSNKNNLYF